MRSYVVLGRVIHLPSHGPRLAATISVLLLLALLIPGVLRGDVNERVSPPASPLSPNEADEQLRRQIAGLERKLATDVCTTDRSDLPTLRPTPPQSQPPGDKPDTAEKTPGRPTETKQGEAKPGETKPGEAKPGEAKPPTDKADVAPPPAPPPIAPDRVPAPKTAAPGAPPSGSLLDHLEKLTVLVLTNSGSGTGFFVTNQLILTNAHVVADSRNPGPLVGRRAVIGNKATGRLEPAEVIAAVGPGDFGQPDFALLKLTEPRTTGVFSFAMQPPARLSNVIAIGYPGFMLRSDPNFQRMLKGEAANLPESSFTQGGVMVVQGADLATPVIIHRASISSGNSGGPLADECGRIVGVNTFVNPGERGTDRQYYALATKAAVAFLRAHNVTPQLLEGHCTVEHSPGGGASPPRPPAPAAPSPTSPAVPPRPVPVPAPTK